MKSIFYNLNLYLYSYIRSGTNRHSFERKCASKCLCIEGPQCKQCSEIGKETRTYCLCLHQWRNSPVNPESETTEPTIRKFGIVKVENLLGAVVLLRHLWVMSWPGPFSSQFLCFLSPQREAFLSYMLSPKTLCLCTTKDNGAMWVWPCYSETMNQRTFLL